MFTIKHALEFQPRGTVSGLFDESAVQLPQTPATPPRTESVANVHMLGANKLAVIPSGRLVSITCLTGALWVTEDRKPVDVVLMPGESFQSSSAGRVIIDAFEASTYRMAVGRAPWWSRLGRAVADIPRLTIRVLRAGWHALQTAERNDLSRAPMPYFSIQDAPWFVVARGRSDVAGELQIRLISIWRRRITNHQGEHHARNTRLNSL